MDESRVEFSSIVTNGRVIEGRVYQRRGWLALSVRACNREGARVRWLENEAPLQHVALRSDSNNTPQLRSIE